MKYRKKPVVIEAMQWDGDNTVEVTRFCTSGMLLGRDGLLRINTLEGAMLVSVGDYVIKGVRGEFYPCKPDIFKETYDEA